MFSKKQMIQFVTETIQGLRDTRYATCDINERLALAKMEVSELRAALLDAEFASDAEAYAAKLKIAQEEYLRVLRMSHKRKAV